MNPVLRTFISIVMMVFLLSFTACEKTAVLKGLIIPHHLFVEAEIEEIYAQNSSEEIERVILLSPNHFNSGKNYIQSSDVQIPQEPPCDKTTIQELAKNSPLALEPTHFPKEHGLTSHFPFIKEHFRNAKIVPISLKLNTPQKQLDQLIEAIKRIDLENTLIIASVDFSHYEEEKSAIKNDERTIEWLKNWPNSDGFSYPEIVELSKSIDKTTNQAIAFDSPESMYVFLKMIKKLNTRKCEFKNRTSVAEKEPGIEAMQNTSHLFYACF